GKRYLSGWHIKCTGFSKYKSTAEKVNLPENGLHCPKRAELSYYGTNGRLFRDEMHKMGSAKWVIVVGNTHFEPE
ncbi:MAG: hypothetical protein WCR72_05665, partial [Bacteroidota bacterium]